MLSLADFHDYQHEIVEHIHEHARCAIWAPMGGGKTGATLTALDALSCVEPVWPALVLAPLRVARSTWPEEPQEWEHLRHLTTSVVTGTPAQRKRALAVKAHIYTINYDNLVWLVETLKKDWPFRTVIADESTRLKSHRLRQGGKRTAALAKMAFTQIDRFIELTGTPAPNGIANLWGQAWFLDEGKRLGRTYSSFEERWFKKGWDGFSMEPLDHAQREIEGLLKDICLTVSGLQVDEPIVNIIPVDLPSAARKLYNAMERDMFAEIAGHGVEAFGAAARTNKCSQLANGACIVDEDGNWEEVHRVKLDALDSVIQEAAGMPVLVAYHYKSDLARLQKAFPHGRTLDADPRTIRDWNDGRISLLFAHPACLHPSTEVLTEFRGWTKIIDVEDDERVFDGVEFVSHKGCSFSGVRSVTTVFGLTMTPEHKLLIGQDWVEAKDVRNLENARRAARYAYSGVDPYLSKMLRLRNRTHDASAERYSGQSPDAQTVPRVPEGFGALHDGDTVLLDLARDEGQGDGPKQPGLQTLWSDRARHVEGVAQLQEFSSRHVPNLPRRSDNRARGQLAGLLQGKLSMGDAPGATVQQEQQSGPRLPGARDASGRVLSCRGREPRGYNSEIERRHEPRDGVAGLRVLDVSEGPAIEVSDVYDLVDCGPRNRFLIRNADGEVFVSHNSAGHGLNLARGGNILAFFAIDWDLELYMQIIERIGPMRQKQAGLDRPVFLHLILARDTVDYMKYERLGTKKSVQSILLEAMKRRRVAA